MIFDENTKDRHIRFLMKHLSKLGSSASSFDKHRLMILFFALSGLDLLNSLDKVCESQRKNLIEWIYFHQLCANDSFDMKSIKDGKFGFRCTSSCQDNAEFEFCNLAMTYCALASLVILGDDLSRVNRKAIIYGMQHYQKPGGNFILALNEHEDDLRTTYCAATICYILNDWSLIDKKMMTSFIKSCLSHDNGFGQHPGTEGHGGTTFCALASLFLLNQQSAFTQSQIDNIIYWCLRRQESGFQGRPYKDPDTCYSFWIGASLVLLDAYQFVNDEQNKEFLLSAQSEVGGFGKYPDTFPDILHTYMSISALSLKINFEKESEELLQPVFPSLNISHRALKHLESLHQKWKSNN